jgi:CRP-like cAMP-binding protein
MPADERTDTARKPIRNKILLAMTELEFQRIRPHLEHVALPAHFSLHEPHHIYRFAYFPNEGLISLVIVMDNGRTVEAGIVGNEGVAGLPAIVGLNRSPLREVMQIAGHGFRIKIRVLERTLDSSPGLQRILRHYTMMLGLHVAQTAACNRLHDIDRRLARWLLMAHDRVDSGTLRITHGFLATMLGSNRPSVSVAAGHFQRMNIIKYTRGALKILDRGALERHSCECYAVIQRYAHMLHPLPARRR